jgi:hypothetical protein
MVWCCTAFECLIHFLRDSPAFLELCPGVPFVSCFDQAVSKAGVVEDKALSNGPNFVIGELGHHVCFGKMCVLVFVDKQFIVRDHRHIVFFHAACNSRSLHVHIMVPSWIFCCVFVACLEEGIVSGLFEPAVATHDACVARYAL